MKYLSRFFSLIPLPFLLLFLMVVGMVVFAASSNNFRNKMTPIGWNKIEDYAYRIVSIEGNKYVLLDYGEGIAICEWREKQKGEE